MPRYVNNWYWTASTSSYSTITWTQYSASTFNRITTTPSPVQNAYRSRTKMEFHDTEEAPADRGDHIKCLNCGHPWVDHWNWSCTPDYTTRYKSNVDPSMRYLTPDMQRKFSHVSQRRLKKKARELLLAQESLLK